jgi:hypothetical protein
VSRSVLLAFGVLCGLPGFVLAQSQPCNPVIDGTYCASQMPKAAAPSANRGVSFNPIQNMGQDLLSDRREDPVTFGAISFRGGENCIGLMRRGQCK